MENTLQEVFDVFSDYNKPETVKRENILPLLQVLRYTIRPNDLERILPNKQEFTLKEIEEIISAETFPLLTAEEILSAFHAFDHKKTGTLGLSTLKNILQAGPDQFTQEEIDGAIEILNPTPEGVVEYSKNISNCSTPLI